MSVSAPHHSTLTALAAAQLAANVAGHVVAVRRKLPYDVAFPRMSGRPENVVRDSWTQGTALSAPIVMLAAQAAATSTLYRRDSQTAVTVLTTLGSLMISGYLGERVVRQRLGGDFDPVETPVAASGLVLATSMALVGARALRHG
jgi:hypothetical protein